MPIAVRRAAVIRPFGIQGSERGQPFQGLDVRAIPLNVAVLEDGDHSLLTRASSREEQEND